MREERRHDGTSEEIWSENGHPRARVRQHRASVDYGQPVRESVYSWYEGHQGEFKDGDEMESGGLYSRVRGHGIRVQERDSVIVFILERVTKVIALAESGADATVVVLERQLQDNTAQLQ